MRRRSVIIVASVLGCAVAVWFAARVVRSSEPERLEPAHEASEPVRAAQARLVSPELRRAAIARAAIWREPAPGLRVPSPERSTIDEVSCRFVLKHLSGTTPKFNCVLENGEEVRIKYGLGAEIPAEAAATRLLRALGFAADEIRLVRRLRCYGCPLEPFAMSKAVQGVRAGGVYERVLDYEHGHDYEWVALERKYDGWPIEATMSEGWAFNELDRVDAAAGGAPRAHVDALRLAAAFLAHWDNKSDNQRLVCTDREWPIGKPCTAPLLMLQDLGATFGPRKVNLRRWRTSAIWADRTSCTVTMKHLPYSGATFVDARVSEEGRQLLSRQLQTLGDGDIANLFAGARFDQKRGLFSDAHPVPRWVAAFKARVHAISDGPPCPPA
jgi:hypothetical protein